MFNRLFKNESARIYLGTLAVAPHSDFKTSIKEWSWSGLISKDLDEELLKSFEEIFTFPLADEATDPKSSHLVLDVIVPDFEGGEFIADAILTFPVLAMWRPKVKVAARLYYLKSKKTKRKFVITKKMSVGEYLNRVFSFRGLLRYKPLFDEKDLDQLISRACYELLNQIKEKI